MAQAETEAAALTRHIEDLTAQLEARSEERRQAERDAANQGAALKQMEGEAQRIERRLQEWTLQAARNKEAREAKHGSRSSRSAKRQCGWRRSARQPKRPSKQQQSAAGDDAADSARRCSRKPRKLTAELAGLEERRRGAEAAFQRIDRLHADLERRVLAIEQQRAAAEAEREQRIRESAELAAARDRS